MRIACSSKPFFLSRIHQARSPQRSISVAQILQILFREVDEGFGSTPTDTR